MTGPSTFRGWPWEIFEYRQTLMVTPMCTVSVHTPSGSFRIQGDTGPWSPCWTLGQRKCRSGTIMQCMQCHVTHITGAFPWGSDQQRSQDVGAISIFFQVPFCGKTKRWSEAELKRSLRSDSELDTPWVRAEHETSRYERKIDGTTWDRNAINNHCKYGLVLKNPQHSTTKSRWSIYGPANLMCCLLTSHGWSMRQHQTVLRLLNII